jgi:hypothetical protein
MNIKLLKELYKQAETECGWSEEKFAELIVKECIGAISEVKERFFKFRLETDDFTEKNRFCAGEDACKQSVRKIETLFGVEE